MIIIIGLGNPGEKFKDTRHNIGFEVLDKIKEENDFPDFAFSKKFNAQISEGILNQEKTILAKPQTFMNSSGKSAKALTQYYKKAKLIIVHDDIDILLGKVKFSKDSGSAGHKGVESVINNLGTKDFMRLRIGIVPIKGKPKETEKFVLKKFTKKEKEIIKEAVNKTVQEINQMSEHEIGNS
jgi:PTH1 family peptidyl-tRNA hydrolase